MKHRAGLREMGIRREASVTPYDWFFAMLSSCALDLFCNSFDPLLFAKQKQSRNHFVAASSSLSLRHRKPRSKAFTESVRSELEASFSLDDEDDEDDNEDEQADGAARN